MEDLVALHNLSGRLHTYDTTVVEDHSLQGEQCLLCWRNFNSKDDDDDTGETPCKPVRLEPCGHVIGDQCLQRLIEHGVRDCQMCKRPIRVLNNEELPSWLVVMAEHPLYKHINTACIREISHTRFAQSLNQHHQYLLDGTIGVKQALWLWLINMSGLLMLASPTFALVIFFRYVLSALPFVICWQSHLANLAPPGGPNACPELWPQQSVNLLVHLFASCLAYWICWDLGVGTNGTRYLITRVGNRLAFINSFISAFLVLRLFLKSLLKKLYGCLFVVPLLGLMALMYAAISALLIWYGKKAMRARRTVHPKSE
ncbi:hypothetical protein PMIN07_008095 [Paraphaeosphaeria minitans]